MNGKPAKEIREELLNDVSGGIKQVDLSHFTPHELGEAINYFFNAYPYEEALAKVNSIWGITEQDIFEAEHLGYPLPTHEKLAILVFKANNVDLDAVGYGWLKQYDR